MSEEKDLATTTLQLLANAAGAEFEDEKVAVAILEELIIQTKKSCQNTKESKKKPKKKEV